MYFIIFNKGYCIIWLLERRNRHERCVKYNRFDKNLWQEILVRVKKIANRLQISDSLKKFPFQVSGGQKQRCAFARAVICNPKIIMADEPTGSLDSHSSQILLEIMSELNKEISATILMVTHDALCASYADRILFLKDGRIFNEILRGEKSRTNFYQEILDVLSLLGGDKPC